MYQFQVNLFPKVTFFPGGGANFLILFTSELFILLYSYVFILYNRATIHMYLSYIIEQPIFYFHTIHSIQGDTIIKLLEMTTVVIGEEVIELRRYLLYWTKQQSHKKTETAKLILIYLDISNEAHNVRLRCVEGGHEFFDLHKFL